MLEVVRNGKNSILKVSPNKSPFNQYYPKSVPNSVPNPDTLIILLLKNEKIGLKSRDVLPATIPPLSSNGITHDILQLLVNCSPEETNKLENWISVSMEFPFLAGKLYEPAYEIMVLIT